jgi:ribose-phosphate pyrophosphokinase
MTIDLRKGFGAFDEYTLTKFPDNSIKFSTTYRDSKKVTVTVSFKTNEDFFIVGFILDYFENRNTKVELIIYYLMYQQDDRQFTQEESFGLKFVSRFLNSFKNIESVFIYHPHSDKVEMIDKCIILSNMPIIRDSLIDMKEDSYWVIPDSGAFKTQFKQIESLDWKNFITCMKSRSHATGQIETIVSCEDLKGQDCFIVDDICLGGRTFINIAQELKKKNCGKLYLIISHGIFNNGIDHLLEYFDVIYTTNSICTLEKSDRLKIYNL